jgi:ABC-type uncharacterized transport system substrate-binding protein
MIKETQDAAGPMRIELQILEVGPEQIRDAFKSMERARPDALIVQQTAPFNAYIKEMADLALEARLPSVHENREYVRAGGLIAYGPDLFASGPITLIEFSRARIRLIFRLSNQPNLYSRSISNLQRRLA